MLTQLRPSFPHRQNSDGSHDSICTLCLATVATVQNEWELAGHESTQVCEPLTFIGADKFGRHNQSVLCSYPRRAPALRRPTHDRSIRAPSQGLRGSPDARGGLPFTSERERFFELSLHYPFRILHFK